MQLGLQWGGQCWTKSANGTLIPPTVTSGPLCSWITTVKEKEDDEKEEGELKYIGVDEEDEMRQ